MFWKEVFVDGGGRGGCAARLFGGLIVGLVFMFPAAFVYNDFIDPYRTWGGSDTWKLFVEKINVWCRVTTGILGALLLLAAAVRGSGCVSGERDRDTWISLVSTPLGAWEMLQGKWLGCILGLRAGIALLLLVWAFSLAVGATAIGLILLAAVHFAVYVSAFAWLGILFSITARTTLLATVRALSAALFVAGGFWLVFMICCVMPLEIMLAAGSRREFEWLYQLLAGLTPPFVLGWLPLDTSASRLELDPFDPEDDGIGLFAPVFGFGVWMLVNMGLSFACWQAFRRVTNRTRDHLTPSRPSQQGWGNQ